MRSIKYIATLAPALLACSSAVAEETYDLFVPSDNQDSAVVSHHQGNILSRQKYSAELGKKITPNSHIRFNLAGEVLEYEIDQINRKKENRLSFSALDTKPFSDDILTLAENDGRIVGSLQREGKLYKLRPDGKGNTLIIEVENQTLMDHDSGYQEEVNADFANSISQIDYDTSSDSSTEFTVIVAYTADFVRDAGDVNAYLDLLELETNTSYANSQVNTRVNIVHSYQTAYDDSGNFYTDRDYFSNLNNTEAQELRTLRDNVDADIMMVLTGNTGYSFCGIAREIGANADSAIGFASETCAAGYYSFGHEIGHLFGARHITATDSNNEPFAYGHGYCNVTANTWRTMMAYNCPTGTGGPRIQQWSNPFVNIAAEPTGTVNTEYNAMVLNVRASEVANFRESAPVLQVPNTPVATLNTSSVSVDWNDIAGATYYAVAIQFNSNAWTEYSYTTSTSAISWANLGPGTRKYRVKACNSNGCTAASGISNAVTISEVITELPAPNTPVASLNGNTITVDWNDVAGADSYAVAIQYGSNAWTDYKYMTSASSISWSNLGSGSRRYMVKACKSGVCYSSSGVSNTVSN